jgi:YD repeat-containing protein
MQGPDGNGSPNITVFYDYQVISGGTYELVSNACSTSVSPCGDPTAGWTRTMRDQNGRVTEVETFTGGATPQAGGAATGSTGVVTTAYAAETATVTDQAGKARKSFVDGRGRLKTVVEDPNGLNLSTTYVYDDLDDLKTVTQGSQTRVFNYDSLRRLENATNPESGTVSYKYDRNGNIVQRTDARARITCYGVLAGSSCDGTGYDLLNRPTRKSYSDGTPTVTYVYDQAPAGEPAVP